MTDSRSGREPAPEVGQLAPELLRAELRELRAANRALELRVRELQCLADISRAAEHSGGELGAIVEEAAGILVRAWGGPDAASARIELGGKVCETPGFAARPERLRATIPSHGQSAGAIEIRTGVPGQHAGGGVGAAATAVAEPEFQSSRAEAGRLLEVVARRLGRTAERLQRRHAQRAHEEDMRERLTHLTRVSTTGELASSIAHEVNQPLTAIATYAQACRRLLAAGDSPPAELAAVLERINAEALRAGGIVHRLKDLVRRHETRWTECDLNALVRDVQQLAAIDARLHDVVLRFELAPDLPPVLADGIQVQQVVLNLIRNGIDAVEEAAPPDPEVVVRTELASARELRVSVQDNGCGLPRELDRKLFQPFFTTKKGGMGMGLSISRSIALAHRGRIDFTRQQRGMVFQLTLPVLES